MSFNFVYSVSKTLGFQSSSCLSCFVIVSMIILMLKDVAGSPVLLQVFLLLSKCDALGPGLQLGLNQKQTVAKATEFMIAWARPHLGPGSYGGY